MTFYYKMRPLFYYKMLLQNALGFLLQNATVLLQTVTVISKCVDFITKCDSYYKMRRLLQNASVHTDFAQMFISMRHFT